MRFTLLAAALVISACGPDDSQQQPPPPTSEPAVEAPAPEVPQVAEPAPSSGLPCDVERVFKANCGTCHGATPANGAPNSLMTRADLLEASAFGGTLAERSVARMRDPSSPMPPAYFAPRVSAGDLAAVGSWVNAGMPESVCASGN